MGVVVVPMGGSEAMRIGGELIRKRRWPSCRQAGRAPAADVFDGWVGYTRPNTLGIRQAWVRDPSTAARIQLTAFTQSPGLVNVVFAPGSAAISGTGGSYIQTFGGGVQPISAHWDTHLYRDGRWLVVILGEVFTLGSGPPPPVDAGVADAPGPADAGPDAPPVDAAPVDAPPIDAPPTDASPTDAPPIDAPAVDAQPVDGASGDDGCGCRTAARPDGLVLLGALP